MDTSVEVMGIIIGEPVNVATDLLVSGVCFLAYSRIGAHGAHRKLLLYFKYFFAVMGLSTLYGGIVGHGFMHYLSFAWKLPGWIISMFAIMLLERAVITHSIPFVRPMVSRILSTANIVEISFLLLVVLITLNFFFVEVHAAYGLSVVVLPLELFIYNRTKAPASRHMLYAVFFSLMSAIAHLSRLAIHKWFNHIDLSHVFMAVSVYMIHRAVTEIESGALRPGRAK